MEKLRAVVSRRVIDRMIREKVAEVCKAGEDVTPMPVVWRQPLAGECNWEIPAWTGTAAAVQRCRARVAPYIELLAEQFDIVDPPHCRD